MECMSRPSVKHTTREILSSKPKSFSCSGRRPALIPHSAVRSPDESGGGLRNHTGHIHIPPPDDPSVQLSIIESIRQEKGFQDRTPSLLQERKPQKELSQQLLLPQLTPWAEDLSQTFHSQESIMSTGPQSALHSNKRKHRSPSEDAALQHPEDMAQDIPHMSEIESQDEAVAEAPSMLLDCHRSNSTLGSCQCTLLS
ncbi:MAG: hypothetical protein M1835_000793 [Candelina submexicana]|nr:MAG: hypothetical protein M1835_000793 [Candelina submexicana]